MSTGLNTGTSFHLIIEPKRFNHFDSLRGIASLFVIASHYILSYGLPEGILKNQYAPQIWWDGTAAVSFFFVLSGLVLSLRHFRETKSPTLEGFSFFGYFQSRICRISLPYLFMILCTVLFSRFTARSLLTIPAMASWPSLFWTNEITLQSLLKQVFNLRQSYPAAGIDMLVPQAWSLNVEIVLSMLVPLAVIAAGRSSWWFLANVVIAVVFVRASIYVVHFALGIVLAKHYRDIIGWLESRRLTRIAILIFGLICYCYSELKPIFQPIKNVNSGLYAQALGSALLLVFASSSLVVRDWLSRGLIYYIGRVSYSIYLVHVLVLFCLTPRIMHSLYGISESLVWSIGLAFTITVSVVLAFPLYQFVEKPAIAIGKFASNKTLLKNKMK